ncbi:hypothetical protein VB834_28885 [Limnoraphis robusta Tam1]|uniref:Transposase n=1 Tax=Limnoraphis robusta CCNP1315 TaxID=3110306 RepID=A0ABU5U2Z4_9CYAN|nr:hypothetical protein [Limnoraphis robusta]MEA5499884.1 hypothetical protein [Limnoraphis robusta BA-68 BA1]MEA5521558.1 hypothetical protein [Limnoraphis robusta CCNP1315]MEA5543053.1 hypothetical protein [Limnoraphis robusta Tam1]MEA5545800.1 hypothetical protein [Limnoraphis robusta CCNP1324]
MPLKERVFNCEACHISIGRDLNASLNARTLRRRLFGLSLSIGYCRQSEMKQERNFNTVCTVLYQFSIADDVPLLITEFETDINRFSRFKLSMSFTRLPETISSLNIRDRSQCSVQR